MSVRNFVPEVWSQNLNLQLRKTRVFESLVNKDYQGEIANQGDTVHIVRPASIAMKAYAGSVVYDTPTSTELLLVVDQARYFAFDMSDVDQVQANINLVAAYAEEGGQAMADDTDTHLAGHYVDVHADNVIATDTYTASTIYSAFVEASKRLNKKNVPASGRWAAVSPEVLALLLQSPEFIKASDLGDRVVQSGALGMVAGFSVYMSNSVITAPETVGTVTSNVQHNLLGVRSAITFAEQIVKLEAARREGSFADYVRGLHLFGSKAVRPEALVDLKHIV